MILSKRLRFMLAACFMDDVHRGLILFVTLSKEKKEVKEQERVWLDMQLRFSYI
jgi:hypothetical protein